MSRAGWIAAAIVVCATLSLAIYGYLEVSGNVGGGSYWAPVVSLFVVIFGGIALAVVVAADGVVREILRWRRNRPPKANI